jgi:hypothetical protein
LQMMNARQSPDAPEHKGHIDDPLAVLNSMYDGRCAWCNTSGAVNKCTRCKSAGYCNRICQKAHWHTHKQTCSVLRVVRRRMERGDGGAIINARQGRTRTKTLRVQLCVSVHPDESNAVLVLRCVGPVAGSRLPSCSATRKIFKDETIILLGYHCNTLGDHYRMAFVCQCECGDSPCRTIIPANIDLMRSPRFHRSMESDPVTCIATLPRGWSVHREECACNCYEPGRTDLTMEGYRFKLTTHHHRESP